MSEEQKPKSKTGDRYYLIREALKCKETITYTDPDKLLEAAREYFETCIRENRGKFTRAGMIAWVGLNGRKWKELSADPRFADTCAAIILILEDHYESLLQWAGSAPGAMFALPSINPEDWDRKGAKIELESGRNVTVSASVELVEPQKPDKPNE